MANNGSASERLLILNPRRYPANSRDPGVHGMLWEGSARVVAGGEELSYIAQERWSPGGRSERDGAVRPFLRSSFAWKNKALRAAQNRQLMNFQPSFMDLRAQENLFGGPEKWQ